MAESITSHFKAEQIEHFKFLPFEVTNQVVSVFFSTLVLVVLLLVAFRKISLVPNRRQGALEYIIEFIKNTIVNINGEKGLKYTPLILSLFLMLLTFNVAGLVPGAFAPSSQFFVLFVLGLSILAFVIMSGIVNYGLKWFSLFVVEGAPWPLVPFLVVLEMISFLIRPFTLAVRLSANIVAGHIALGIFAGFVAAAFGSWTAIFSPLPFAVLTAITCLELFVAGLQAYIFTVLVCVYLNDAINIEH